MFQIWEIMAPKGPIIRNDEWLGETYGQSIYGNENFGAKEKGR